MAIEVFILRDLLVAIKCFVPVVLIKWWQRAHYWFPLCDGKAGACEPGDTTHYKLNYDHQYARNKPPGYRPVLPVFQLKFSLVQK